MPHGNKLVRLITTKTKRLNTGFLFLESEPGKQQVEDPAQLHRLPQESQNPQLVRKLP
jgi:hypothetical protein